MRKFWLYGLGSVLTIAGMLVGCSGRNTASTGSNPVGKRYVSPSPTDAYDTGTFDSPSQPAFGSGAGGSGSR